MKVSVIIPNYNYGHLIHEAIESALNQTVKPHEIIVVDDCSIKYNMEFENAVNTLPVKVIRHKINKGGGASRNTGIKYSSGDYILLLDADDYLHPTYIEKSIGKGDIVSGWIEYAGTKTGIRKFKETPVYTDFLERNQIVNTTIFKRSVWVDVKGFDEKLTGLEDWMFWLSATKKGYKVHVIQEVMSYYRRHSHESRNHGSARNYKELSKYIFENH